MSVCLCVRVCVRAHHMYLVDSRMHVCTHEIYAYTMGFVCGSSALATLTPSCPLSLARALPVAQRRSLCVFLSFSSVRTNAMTRRWQMHTESLDAALADRLIETAEKMHQSREASFSFASEVEQVRQLCARRACARACVCACARFSFPLSVSLSPPLSLSPCVWVCGCAFVRTCVRACVCVCAGACACD